MKKITFDKLLFIPAILLLAAIGLALSCGGGKEEPGQETGPVTLTYWQTYNDDENALFAGFQETVENGP